MLCLESFEDRDQWVGWPTLRNVLWLLVSNDMSMWGTVGIGKIPTDAS